MFRPRDSHDLRVLATDLEVSPESSVRMIQDPLSNSVALVQPLARADTLEIVCSFPIEHAHSNNLELPLSPSAEIYPVRLHARGALRPRALPAAVPRRSRRRADRVGAPVHPHRRPDRHARAADRDEPAHPRQLPLRRRATRKERRARSRRCRRGSGSCRDFALLMMEAARRLGIATRFVSGYLYDPALDGGDGANVTGAGFTHAWLQAYLPGAGWVPFDPTNNLLGGNAADPRRHRPRSVAGGADLGQLVRRDRRLPGDDGQRRGDAALSATERAGRRLAQAGISA